ncbi:MAG: hypothetical protein AB7S75_18265 [Desulfococcaceae bacterium]
MKIAMIKRIWLVVVFIPLIVFSANVRAKDILIIVNESVGIDEIEKRMLTEIYQGIRIQWDNGEMIRVVMLKSGPVHENFADNVIGISPSKLITIWKKAIFTGTGSPPKIFRDETELVRYIAETKGSVGYIDASTPHKGVKILSLK